MTRRVLASALALAVAAAAVGGCTFLIPFDEVPVEDGGITSPSSTTPPTGQPDAARDGGPIDGDRDGAVDYSAVCEGKDDGRYCNGNRIGLAAGSKDDLIFCLNDRTVSVKRCTKGSGCVPMPNGYPDECDECDGKSSGLYCGDDFVDWSAKNAIARIRCDNGRIVGNILCATKCVGAGPTASCQ